MLKRHTFAPAGLRALLGRFTVDQISMLMGLLGLVFVVVTASFIVWHERRTLLSEGRDHAAQSAFFLADHAKRLFEVSDIALHASLTAAADKDWDTIEASPELVASMRSINDALPYVNTLWLADAAGLVRATTLAGTPPHYSIADRAVFTDAQVPGDRLIIGEPIVGRLSHQATFLVARRMETATGAFRGIAGSSMDLSYFTDYWRQLDARNDEQIAIVHAVSGSVLVSYPAMRSPGAADPVQPGIPDAADGMGSFEPGPHTYGYFHRIGNLPVFVTVMFKDSAINAAWRAWLWRFLPFVAAALLALAAMMGLGRKLAVREGRARREVEAARALLSASNVRLEQRVAERTADLQESNQEIQRFAYIVSHDLRAPLVNIMGFTSELENLRDDLFEARQGAEPAVLALRQDFDESIGFIKSSIDKMDRLIKAILTLSRQGQQPFRPERLDMDATMQSIADSLAHRMNQTGTEVMIDPLPPITTDRIAVEQVFSNLLDNAVKYLRPGVPGRIRVSAQRSATTATFEVRDNGRGIDARDRERVFELFRRAGTQDQPGEGIGLAHVRSLVRRLQGTIRLDSVPGQGSVFTVVLPIAAAAWNEDSAS